MGYAYVNGNKGKTAQTAKASKYPQGYFKEKPCRMCGTLFMPNAPSELYCSDTCKDRGMANNYLKRNYGIMMDDYDRIYKEQKGLCCICGTEGFIMNKDRHKLKLVVDHCHETGKVRGLLCHNCNRALGLLKDNVDYLKIAIKYLEGATTNM